MRIVLLIVSIILTLTGIIVSVVFFVKLNDVYTYSTDGSILMAETGQVGDFIGGIVGTIFSLSGFILLLLTLHVQSKSSYVEQFESKFFELIRLHRENVGEIHINRQMLIKDKLTGIDYFGRKSFRIIVDDFITCRNDIKPFFVKYNLDEIYEEDFKQKLAQILASRNNKYDLLTHAKINIAYCIVFYGVGFEGELVIRTLLKGKYKAAFVDELIKYIQMKPIESSDYWKNWKALKKFQRFEYRLEIIKQIISARSNKALINRYRIHNLFYGPSYVKYYGGHQHRLGHYFRHLFQSIKFVNSQRKLSDTEKYFYAKTLRAQLSTYEQALLFVNSISFLGLVWELNSDYKKSKIEFIDNKRKKASQLITKYNLIKNLPGEHIYGIRYKHYYPEVKYEIDNQVL